jgi:hypothetical protein
MNQPGAFLERLDYHVLMPLNLSYHEGLNSLLGEVGLLNVNRKVEVGEDIAKMRVFSCAERKIGADEPSHNSPLEFSSIERADQVVGHPLISGAVRIEIEEGGDGSRVAALALELHGRRRRPLTGRISKLVRVEQMNLDVREIPWVIGGRLPVALLDTSKAYPCTVFAIA